MAPVGCGAPGYSPQHHPGPCALPAYQRCALVQAVAHEFTMERLDLPTYTPNVNLIERCWRFVKKPCLDSRYYPDSLALQQVV
jgi:DDE superfamily endonuclease